MRILFTNIAFRGFSGTESYLADLVPLIRGRGHEVACLTTSHLQVDTGAGARLRALGIPVADHLADVPWEPDVIHAHHRLPALVAAARFPQTPMVFVVHDASAPTDAPPRMPSIVQYVAVDHLCARRFEAAGIAPMRTSVIHNSVDLERFRKRPKPLPDTPSRALLFMGYLPDYAFADVITRACGKAGIGIDRVMLGGKVSTAPERILGGFDIVFAKARCAMEAMATGAAVVLCSDAGLGPMVTQDNFDEGRRFNFGRELLTAECSDEAVGERIASYDPASATAVSDRIREEAALPGMADRLLELYDRMRGCPIDGDPPGPDELRELAAYVSELEMRWADRPWPQKAKLRLLRWLRGEYSGG